MFKRQPISAAVSLALGIITLQAAAQTSDTQPQLQRVEITGSSLRQLAGQTALPVQTISAAEIARSGYGTVTDLLQNLPSMQGFVTNSTSSNGGGNGNTSASIHGLGTAYTLVLLNGRRLAPYDTGSSVNLNVIPLSAVERVEVLTDGASALYGSDAIAGVVNLITKKNSTAGSFDFSTSHPQHSGGGSRSISVSKGFGDLANDKWNFRIAAGFDKQNELSASQRSFSKSGVLDFFDQGKAHQVSALSSSSGPANIPTVTLSNGQTLANINAYLLTNGSCPTGQIKSGNRCLFTYTTQADSLPKSGRASLYANGTIEVSENATIFSELSLARYSSTPAFASGVQPNLAIPASLLAKDIDPLLPALGYPAGTKAVSGRMNVRVVDTGPRRERFTTESVHAVLGSNVSLGSWDATATYSHSENRFKDQAKGGYVSLNALQSLMTSGAWDPLMAAPGTSAGILSAAVLDQTLDQSKSTLDILSVRGSTSVGQLSAGPISIGVGADFTRQKFSDDPSAIAQGTNALQPTFTDAVIGGYNGLLPFNASRDSYGLFSEAELPITKTIALTGSLRYDAYEAVENSANFDSNGNPVASATQGSKNSSPTFKLSLRFQPTREVLIRGSIGTGFKAPSLMYIAQPLRANGATAFHSCPPGLTAELAALCSPALESYNAQSGGNPLSGEGGLKPEKSLQWTAGFRYEPSKTFGIGADFWGVRIKDQINTITEETAFSDGALYGSLFRSAVDPVSGARALTFFSAPLNTGTAKYQGVDLDATMRHSTAAGALTSRVSGTYMFKADYQSPGVPGYLTSLGHIGSDGNVVFRYLLNASMTLETGAWTNTIQASFKPGYMDSTSSYCRRNANGACSVNSAGVVEGRKVSSYTLFDWQGRYKFSEQISVTVGVKNIFDRDPPLSLTFFGGSPIGFDGRYTDPIGRALYVRGNYKF